MNQTNVLAAMMLLVVGCFTLLISFYCVRIPYTLTQDKSTIKRAAPLFVYFFCIGAGFMFVEISQIERLSTFLGHPVYGLAVVLFALLLSTGLGSFLCEHWLLKKNVDKRLAVGGIILVLVVYALISGGILNAATLATTPIRIVTAAAALFPLGVMLGCAFPVGMTVTLKNNESLAPWLWGMNGAASVCASVLAIGVAMFAGITASLCLGIICYGGALVALSLYQRTTETVS